MDFTEIEIAKLFGQKAAESEDPDRLKEYYVKSNNIFHRLLLIFLLEYWLDIKELVNQHYFKLLYKRIIKKKACNLNKTR